MNASHMLRLMQDCVIEQARACRNLDLLDLVIKLLAEDNELQPIDNNVIYLFPELEEAA